MRRLSLALLAILALAGCTLPAADQPAAPNRMGRFLGLVASCHCSDISPERMVAEYPKAAGGRYSDADIQAMKGYVALGATEAWDNQASICAGACMRACMVNAVAAPLGGKLVPGVAPCLVNERDLNLEQPLATFSD